jgi:hypothetical protein
MGPFWSAARTALQLCIFECMIIALISEQMLFLFGSLGVRELFCVLTKIELIYNTNILLGFYINFRMFLSCSIYLTV